MVLPHRTAVDGGYVRGLVMLVQRRRLAWGMVRPEMTGLGPVDAERRGKMAPPVVERCC